MGNSSSQIQPEYNATIYISNSNDKYHGIFTLSNVSKIDNENKHKFILGIIDVQNDFFISGSLPIKNSEEIIAPINKLRFVCDDYMETFLSQDYHNKNHMSFASTHNATEYEKKILELEMPDKSVINVTQDMWPNHCVEGTKGVNLHSDLIITSNDKFFKKGTITNVESYSAFGDEFNAKYENTGLNKWLTNKNITDIILVGVATDFCVYNTALDSIQLGYKVHLILSCVRGVKEDTTKSALDDLKSKGTILYDSVDEFIEKNKKLFLLK